MSICQIEERKAGRSYPRTCPTCRLGPCSRGHDYKSMREQIATQAAEIERLTRERDAERRARMVAHDHYESRTLEDDRAHAKAIRDLRAQADGHDARATAAEAAKDRAWALYNHQSEARVAVTAERDEALARATAAEAEAERLREELSLIAVMGDSHDPAVCSAIAYHAVKRARAALKERRP